MGGYGGCRSFRVGGSVTIPQIVYDFLLEFQSNYNAILCQFPDKATSWSKITILITRAHLHTMGDPLEFHKCIWCEEAKSAWLLHHGGRLCPESAT